MPAALMGAFTSHEDADRSVEALRKSGVDEHDISVIVQPAPPAAPVRSSSNSEVTAGATTGAITGGIIGGLIGYLLSLGIFDISGIGQYAVQNPTGSIVAGIGLGAALLGLLGAIAGIDFNQHDESPQTAEAFVTVRSATVSPDDIESVFRKHKAVSIHPADDWSEPDDETATQIVSPEAPAQRDQ